MTSFERRIGFVRLMVNMRRFEIRVFSRTFLQTCLGVPQAGLTKKTIVCFFFLRKRLTVLVCIGGLWLAEIRFRRLRQH